MTLVIIQIEEKQQNGGPLLCVSCDQGHIVGRPEPTKIELEIAEILKAGLREIHDTKALDYMKSLGEVVSQLRYDKDKE